MSVDYRRIDCLVAEKVMGWKRTHTVVGIEMWDNHRKVSEWEPSEEMADAWLVADKLKIAIIPQSESAPMEMKYLAEYNHKPWEEPGIEVFAETAPLAICLAALKACGVEVEGC